MAHPTAKSTGKLKEIPIRELSRDEQVLLVQCALKLWAGAKWRDIYDEFSQASMRWVEGYEDWVDFMSDNMVDVILDGWTEAFKQYETMDGFEDETPPS